MNHARRGIALVINIRAYDHNPDKLKERKWSEQDVVTLKKTLEYLEFDFRFYENLTANNIKDEIHKIAEIDHKDSDCFLCVIMSHGDDGKIFASDSEELSFEEIMAPIKSCASLQNKPKLFFFQACRGNKEMEATNHRPDSGVSTSSGHEPDNNDERTSNNNKTINLKQITKQRTKIESEADLLVYYSTIPNHYSYGNVTEGTIFIKSVCKELNEAYKNLPNNIKLSEMLVNINNSVSESGKQLALPELGLLKDVNFTPKEVSKYLKQ